MAISPTQKFTTYTSGPTNQRPVAVLATTRIDAVIGSTIQLDGRGSYDPAGTQVVVWKWRFVQVPIGSLAQDSGLRSIRPKSTAVAFTPDKTGAYVVELIVNDGELDSTPVTALVNVQISRVPCGENIVPDAHFLWSYLSDFWTLVEDREVITSVWSSYIQALGSDLVRLWSYDYNKSLATIQNTFQRRWLQYSMVTDLSEVQDQRVIIGKNDAGTNGTTGAVGSTPGVGNTSVFHLPLGSVGGGTETDFTNLAGNYGAKGRMLIVNGEGFTIDRVANEGSETVAIVDEGAIPDGQIGTTWRIPQLLHVPSVDLEDEGVRPGDILVLEAIRLDIGLRAEVRCQIVGVDRSRVGFEFSMSQLADTEVGLDRGIFEQAVRDIRIIPPLATDAQATSAAEALISFMPVGINLATRPFSTYRLVVRAKSIIHNTTIKVPDDLINAPALQEHPKDPPVVLRENLDYIIEDGYLTFANVFSLDDPPPDNLWAECSYFDNSQAIEDNFGRMVGLTKDALAASQTRAPYLSAVKGLFFAYTNGPTVANIRLGLQILLGLPFSDERGEVLEIGDNYSTSSTGEVLGRILIEDVDENNRRLGFRRLYFYPSVVGLEVNPVTNDIYQVGDIVERFSPLSKGVVVEDYIKTPDWWLRALSGAEFLKFTTFRVVIESDRFDSNDIVFALDFLRKIKPAYTKVITTAVLSLSDDIELEESLGGAAILNFYESHWGLEASLRVDDHNQQGCPLWNVGSVPFSTRVNPLLQDVVTVLDSGFVRATSVTGWSTDEVRGRMTGTATRPVIEGDILVIQKGQLGASVTHSGMYEIDSVIDGNTLQLLAEATPYDPTTLVRPALDTGLFEYGTGLKCCVLRRDANPVIRGADLSLTNASNEVTSASAKFVTNGIGPGDLLVLESGTQAPAVYAIDQLSTPPDTFISETQVALKGLDGAIPSFAIESGVEFRVVRPAMLRRVIEGARSVYNGTESRMEIEVLDTSGDAFDVFTPNDIGKVVEITDSDLPANDGKFLITIYIHPGKVATDSASATSDTGAQAVLHM